MEKQPKNDVEKIRNMLQRPTEKIQEGRIVKLQTRKG